MRKDDRFAFMDGRDGRKCRCRMLRGAQPTETPIKPRYCQTMFCPSPLRVCTSSLVADKDSLYKDWVLSHVQRLEVLAVEMGTPGTVEKRPTCAVGGV